MEFIQQTRKALAKHTTLLSIVAFCIVGIVVFSPVFHFQFLSDDWDLIYHADRYESFADRFTQNDHQTNEGFSYRPMVGIYLTVLKSLFGLNPTGYHVFFVLVHILNAVLVMMLARKLVSKWEGEQVGRCLSWIPFIAGFLFLILPAHVEAVAWIAAGVDVVATFFYLLSLLSFLKFLSICHSVLDTESKLQITNNKKTPIFSFLDMATVLQDNRPGHGMTYYALSILLFIFGLLTKEIVITLPAVLLALCLWRVQSNKHSVTNIHDRANSLRYFFDALKCIAPFIVIVTVYLWLRYQATGSLMGYYGRQTVGIDVHQWIRMISDLLSSFVSWDQMRLRISNIFYHNFHWLVVALALVVLYIKKFHKAYLRMAGLSAVIFVISILPVLPLGFNPLSDEGERYGYLPSVFFVILCAFVLVILIHHERKRFSNIVYVGISLICLVYFGYGLHQKVSLWQQYQDSNYQILNQLYELNDGRMMLLVGLPDSYSGVQGFRNGIAEAYQMYFGESIEIVRIPVYTVDGVDTIHATRITYQGKSREYNPHGYTINDGYDSAIPNQLFLKTKDKSLRLTGEKEYQDEYVKVGFFRWHYDTNRSDGVTIMLRDDFVQAVDGGTIRMLLYDGSYLFDALL